MTILVCYFRVWLFYSFEKVKEIFNFLLKGENPLHIAIVAEDSNFVSYLLKNGADVNQPACGSFFIPDDQRRNQKIVLTNEIPETSSTPTNYIGNAYFGNYPLSFAACWNQTESVRMCMAHGADVNKQDLNGNTVLHMLFIHDNLVIFLIIFF